MLCATGFRSCVAEISQFRRGAIVEIVLATRGPQFWKEERS